MRYITAFVLMFISGSQAFSQKYEVGPFIGGANYIGDVGSSNYINPKTLVFGGLFKYNQSTRHSFRFSFLYAEIEADDANSHDTRRQERGYYFSNTIMEASLGLEYTFWEFDLNSATKQSTPYLYTGLNYYFANHLRLNTEVIVDNSQLEKAGKKWEFSIPMVIGYKQSLNSFLTGGIEIGARYTFTDNLDGSKPSELGGGNELDFGNPNTTDWYMFTGVYLTFYFGRQPCYNNF